MVGLLFAVRFAAKILGNGFESDDFPHLEFIFFLCN